MKKASRKKRIRILRDILSSVRYELMQDVEVEKRHTFAGAHLSDVARIIVRRHKEKVVDLGKRMDDLEVTFSTFEDSEPVYEALLKALGDGSGHETREGMSLLSLVEKLARNHRRESVSARQYQKIASEQAETLTRIKDSLLEAFKNPNENLSPEQLADAVAPMVAVLWDMLDSQSGVMVSGLLGLVKRLEGDDRLDPVDPDPAAVPG